MKFVLRERIKNLIIVSALLWEHPDVESHFFEEFLKELGLGWLRYGSGDTTEVIKFTVTNLSLTNFFVKKNVGHQVRTSHMMGFIGGH